MTKLETIKEEVKVKIGEKLFTRLEETFTRFNLPSNAEVHLWQDVLANPEKSLVENSVNSEEYEKFLEGLEDDIQKRGKDAILYILDNVRDISEPRLKKILRSHTELLKSVMADNLEAETKQIDKVKVSFEKCTKIKIKYNEKNT